MTARTDVECLAVDWSGALQGSAARIWMARATNGVLTALDMPGSRAAVGELLALRRSDPAPCLVGLDFAFGFPAWFAAERGWRTIDQVWRAACDEGERWLSECASPFWGRVGKRRTHDPAHGLRRTERHWAAAGQPKSTLQLGGAGSVGTGTVRGMPLLQALRREGWSIWPFDSPGTHTAVEIYPRLFTGSVVKRHDATRLAYLSSAANVRLDFRDAMTQSEDAFDAGLSALAMSRALQSGADWPSVDPASAIEGQIWAPGAADQQSAVQHGVVRS